MKKTIKEDQERLILQSELINDNSLLEEVANQGFIDVTVRFVGGPITGIKEHTLLHMNIVDYMRHKEHLLEMNENKDSIAIFMPKKAGYTLSAIYDTVEHEFSIPEFLDIEYKRRFPNQPFVKSYTKKEQ